MRSTSTQMLIFVLEHNILSPSKTHTGASWTPICWNVAWLCQLLLERSHMTDHAPNFTGQYTMWSTDYFRCTTNKISRFRITDTLGGEFLWNGLHEFRSWISSHAHCCPACRTYLIATRFWVVVICPIIKCLTVLEFSFILFDLCLFITIFNFILNYVPIVTFWIFTCHKIWILLIIFCFIWNYWIIYFLTCLEVFWGVVS